MQSTVSYLFVILNLFLCTKIITTGVLYCLTQETLLLLLGARNVEVSCELPSGVEQKVQAGENEIEDRDDLVVCYGAGDGEMQRVDVSIQQRIREAIGTEIIANGDSDGIDDECREKDERINGEDGPGKKGKRGFNVKSAQSHNRKHRHHNTQFRVGSGPGAICTCARGCRVRRIGKFERTEVLVG